MPLLSPFQLRLEVSVNEQLLHIYPNTNSTGSDNSGQHLIEVAKQVQFAAISGYSLVNHCPSSRKVESIFSIEKLAQDLKAWLHSEKQHLLSLKSCGIKIYKEAEQSLTLPENTSFLTIKHTPFFPSTPSTSYSKGSSSTLHQKKVQPNPQPSSLTTIATTIKKEASNITPPFFPTLQMVLAGNNLFKLEKISIQDLEAWMHQHHLIISDILTSSDINLVKIPLDYHRKSLQASRYRSLGLALDFIEIAISLLKNITDTQAQKELHTIYKTLKSDAEALLATTVSKTSPIPKKASLLQKISIIPSIEMLFQKNYKVSNLSLCQSGQYTVKPSNTPSITTWIQDTHNTVALILQNSNLSIIKSNKPATKNAPKVKLRHQTMLLLKEYLLEIMLFLENIPNSAHKEKILKHHLLLLDCVNKEINFMTF